MTATTRINRGWLIKTGVYFAAMVGLGAWGLYDGIVAYPAHGRNAAEFLEKIYLQSAERAGALAKAPVEDPSAELARLRPLGPSLKKQLDKGSSASIAVADTQMESDRLEWLTQLERSGRLKPTHTRMAEDVTSHAVLAAPDAAKRLRDLESKWASKTAPKPLSAFDIPAQWIIAAAGLGAGLWILLLTLGVAAKKYRWDAEKLALTLPGGKVIEPKDIREVDKRKWDKFLVFLQLKDGGGEIRLDLLRYTPLEEWVLELERHTEGYEPPLPATDAASTGAASVATPAQG